MDRLTIRSEYLAQRTVDGLYKDLERRIVASPPGQCPAEMTASFSGTLPFTKLRQMRTVPCGTGAAWIYN